MSDGQWYCCKSDYGHHSDDCINKRLAELETERDAYAESATTLGVQIHDVMKERDRYKEALESIAANHMTTPLDKRHLNRFTTEELEDCIIEDTRIAREALKKINGDDHKL